MKVTLCLSVIPDQKRQGYHTRELERDIELPFVPFAGLKILPKNDDLLVVTCVYWIESNATISVDVIDELMPKTVTEFDVDNAAQDYIEQGWHDSVDSHALSPE